MADRPVIEIGPRGGRIVGHHAGHGGKPVAEYEGHVGGALRPSQQRLFDSPRTLTLKPPEERERRSAAGEAQTDLFGPPRTIALRPREAAMERRVTKPTKPLPWAAEKPSAAAKLEAQTAARSAEKPAAKDYALPAGESRWHGGIKATRDGRSVNLTGATYPVKDSLAALGAKWNGEHRAWRLSHDKYTAAHDRIQRIGEKAHDASAAEKRGETTPQRSAPSGGGGARPSGGGPSEKQLHYARSLIRRMTPSHWHDSDYGQGTSHVPTSDELQRWSARDLSALIDDMRDSLGIGSAYKDLSGAERLAAQVAERAA